MRPRLKRTLSRVETPEGDLLLLRSSGTDVKIEHPDRRERELLDHLDGSRPTSELAWRFGEEELARTLAQLESLGLIEDATQDELLAADVRERCDRQLRYLGDLADGGRTAAECQLTLAASRVVVFGAGGLGGRVALDLASIGVGELVLVDGDRIELSNLNRQTQYVEAEIGLLKVERLAARLRAFNSATRVVALAEQIESEARLAKLLVGADLLVDAADWPAHLVERWCNSACFAAGVPYIAMGHFPPIARVGPLYVPGRTGCFACQEIAYRRRYPLYDLVIEQRAGEESPAPTLGPACGVTAGLVATEVLHFLTGIAEPRTLGARHTLDLRTLRLKRHEVVPERACPVCAGAATGGAA